jgi:hypothetical protein
MRSILLINLGIKPPKEIVAKVVISISEKLTKEYAVHGDAAVSAIDEFKFLVLDYLNL